MKAQLFAIKLKEISPTKEFLNSLGFTGIHNDVMWNSFNLMERVEFEELGDELLNLISNYKMEISIIQGVKFSKSIVEKESYYIVGEFDVYQIILDKRSKVISALDLTDELEHAFDIAKDSTHFLGALFLSMQYFSKKLNNKSQRNPENKALYRKQCSEAAGGSEFSFFYENLLIK